MQRKIMKQAALKKSTTKTEDREDFRKNEKRRQLERLKDIKKGSVGLDLFSVRDVAAILNVSYGTVDKLLRDKEIKCVWIRRLRRIEKVALAEYRTKIKVAELFPVVKDFVEKM